VRYLAAREHVQALSVPLVNTIRLSGGSPDFRLARSIAVSRTPHGIRSPYHLHTFFIGLAAWAARFWSSRRGRSELSDFSTPPGPSPGYVVRNWPADPAGDGGRSARSATSHRNGSAENHLRPGNEDLHAGMSGSWPATACRRLSPSARRLDRAVRATRWRKP
jgi:hypothetical protein